MPPFPVIGKLFLFVRTGVGIQVIPVMHGHWDSILKRFLARVSISCLGFDVSCVLDLTISAYFNLYINYILDISGIIEKFNVYVTLAIIPRTKNTNKDF